MSRSGLLTMAAAKALGARRVIAVDIQSERLDFAKSYAATDAFLPGKPRDSESKIDYSTREAERMRKELDLEEGGVGALDVVVDCSGAETCIQMGLMVLKTRGKFVQVSVLSCSLNACPLNLAFTGRGMGAPNVQIPISTLLSR